MKWLRLASKGSETRVSGAKLAKNGAARYSASGTAGPPRSVYQERRVAGQAQPKLIEVERDFIFSLD